MPPPAVEQGGQRLADHLADGESPAGRITPKPCDQRRRKLDGKSHFGHWSREQVESEVERVAGSDRLGAEKGSSGASRRGRPQEKNGAAKGSATS